METFNTPKNKDYKPKTFANKKEFVRDRIEWFIDNGATKEELINNYVEALRIKEGVPEDLSMEVIEEIFNN